MGRSSTSQPPGPAGLPLLGVLPHMRRDPLGFLAAMAHRYGDVVSLPMGPRPALLIRHPDHIARVLQDNHRNYRKSVFVKKLKPFLGEGLGTSEGEEWKRQRRLMQPAFARDRLAGLANIVIRATDDMLVRWGQADDRPVRLDLFAEMMRLTGEIIVKAMFGTSSPCNPQEVLADFSLVTQHSLDRILALVDLGTYSPTRKGQRYRRALERLDQVVWGIIQTRTHDPGPGGDLLAMLLAARDFETGSRMDATRLRDEVMTIFFAGHETTGLALTWTWFLLSRHADWERRLRQEVQQALNGCAPGFDDLPRLRYTKMVVQEAMRLYPPAWILSRSPVEDDAIGGYRVPSGSIVLISPFLTHRHPAYWGEPEEFRPERFDPERNSDRPRYAYFPFSGGPRHCLGEQFALMEAQLIVARVIQACRLTGATQETVRPHPLLTLRPQHGLPMAVEFLPPSAGTLNS